MGKPDGRSRGGRVRPDVVLNETDAGKINGMFRLHNSLYSSRQDETLNQANEEVVDHIRQAGRVAALPTPSVFLFMYRKNKNPNRTHAWGKVNPLSVSARSADMFPARLYE
uniref:Uncharacterized protein n=1 Tax=Candidatus Kentrum sp. TUN TaxID=2126343 RepID=A0A450ZVQ8_9GAMM|nr:MAG: hypothetical protein BECKTUN1418F_GA0071002_11293 [Candidatus Kentron sp. TUN]VFK66595.1 MAG: hypothetical protein BECKTUN1418E_GA0071001_11234 [Candidatus Kentron sp. TUN]